MKFITNCIQTGNGKTFDDFVRSVLKKDEIVKTASTGTVVKKAAEQEEAESSGQLDVEPLHQKGESTEMPKKGPSAKKDDDACKCKKTEAATEKDEADSSGQPEWEGKKENNNDPKEEKKEAAALCEKCKKEPCECKEDCDCKSCKASKEAAKAKTAALEDLPQEVQDKIKGKKSEGKDEKDEKDEKKDASAKKFVKIANLDAKNKAFLKEFWKKLYPEAYVNALLADK